VRDRIDPQVHSRQGKLGAFAGELSDADDTAYLQPADEIPKRRVTDPEEIGGLDGVHLVRSDVLAARLHEGQRTIVGHKMLLEKVLGAGVSILDPAPEAATAHLRTGTGVAHHGALRMHGCGRLDDRIDMEVLLNQPDLAKRNPCLHHAKRPWIHAQEQDLARRSPIFSKVLQDGSAGIDERVVNVRHGGGEAHPIQLTRQSIDVFFPMACFSHGRSGSPSSRRSSA